MSADESYRVNSPKVVSESIDGEVVIVDLDQGNYYSLMKTGHSIWSDIEKGFTRSHIVNSMLAQYEGSSEDISAAVGAFIDELLREKLIVVDVADGNVAQSDEQTTAATTSPVAFELPTLEKFTDMEDLLLLDPIHEVDEEAGWPNVKNNVEPDSEREKTLA